MGGRLSGQVKGALIQAETLELLEWPRLCQHLATFAATKVGAIAARQLAIPATQRESQTLLDQTQEAYQLELALDSGLRFEGICDIGASLERVGRQGILSGEALLAIATTLAGARQLRRTIDNQENVPILADLVADLRTYPELEQTIHHCIDEQGNVADRASTNLASIRQNQRRLRDQIHQTLQRILQRQSQAVQESIIAKRGDRFVIPVKAPQKDAIPGIVHDTSSSGATLYVEPHRIVEPNNRLRQLLRQEQAEEEAIRQTLSQQVAAVQSDLEHLLAIVTTLDLSTARARYSLWLDANPPRFIDCDDGEITTLRQLRHPLLVWQHQHEQGVPVVPIDLSIQPQIRVVAITGPNTGGKTVTLKTLGLAALMAKAGIFIPAREPVELPWFEQVLADIGDEQSLQQSLSTFSGHIHRISRILDAVGEKGTGNGEWGTGNGERGMGNRERGMEYLENPLEVPSNPTPDTSHLTPHTSHLTPHTSHLTPHTPHPISPSLILLDEVGAGTDPSEGSALAIALLQFLAEQVQLTMATTHFGELKTLKYQDDRFENASVEFDDRTLSPTYRLLWGIPGRSNALTIAQRLGLNVAVVERAQGYVGGTSAEINQMIAGLEDQRRHQEARAAEASQLLHQADRLHQEIAQKTAVLQERERQLKAGQEQAVQAAIAEAKREIAQVIRRLQAGPATAQAAKHATDALNQIAEQRLPSAQLPEPKAGFCPQVGDRIRISSLGKTAEVLSAANRDGELMVRFGQMKMTVSLAEIESLDGQKAEPPPKPKSAPAPPAVAATPAPAIRTERNTVDLRGSRVEAAEVALEAAIAKQFRETQTTGGTLWIIHGRGTGRLRQGVREFLDHHPQVERYEQADQKEGGSGVTIAYLK